MDLNARIRIMYTHFIQKDLPDTVVDFNADATLRNVPPIIAGNNNSVVVGAGATRTVPISGLGPGAEGKSFTIESWLLPLGSSEVYSFDHTNASIKWAAGIHFTVRIDGADISLVYEPPVTKAFHVVGTYNRHGITLIVDGVLVDSLQFDNPPTTVWAADEDAAIGTGTGKAVVDGVAFYTRELSSAVANDHYLLGTVIPAITTNLSGLSSTILNFEKQEKFLITRAQWPDWEPGVRAGVEIVDNALYSESGGTWNGFIPMPDYDVVQKGRVSWDGDASISISKDGGATWQNIDSSPGYIPGISGSSPMTVDIRATFTAGATLRDLTVELYDSLEYDMGLSEASAAYGSPNIINADAAYNQLEYRADRGFYTNGAGGIEIDYDTSTEPEPIYAVDMWVKMDDVAVGTLIWAGPSSAASYLQPAGWFSAAAADQVYVNGQRASVEPIVFRVGEWTHVLFKLAVPRVTDLLFGFDAFKGSFGSVTIFKEDVAGQEQRIYRSYFGGERLDLSDDAGLTISEGGWDLYSYDWTSIGS